MARTSFSAGVKSAGTLRKYGGLPKTKSALDNTAKRNAGAHSGDARNRSGQSFSKGFMKAASGGQRRDARGRFA